MAKQTINQGTAPTGAGGDTFRTGSAKLQANDNELYTQLGATAQGVLPNALPINKGGTGATTAADARNNLGLGGAATRQVSEQVGDVMAVGAFGLGGNIPVLSNVSSPQDLITKLGTRTKFTYVTGAIADTPLGNYSIGLNLFSGGDQVFVAFDVTGKKSGYIAKTSSGVYSATKFYTDQNTTVDSNGFIKAASPIVKLFADRIELNDEAEQQKITFEKLGVGDYLIKGSSGFAQEGWYVETPKDANGNVLVAVVYEQIANGDISVKTYDYMLNNKGRIVADTETPLDIPETRWIDLRLQEIEVTDDPEQ